MTKDEALKLAFEALKDMNCGWKYIRESHGDLYGVGWDRAQQKADDAIAALRQALEQPDDAAWARHLKEPIREWVGLTDEEVDCLEFEIGHDNFLDFARAIEAKLKEKNYG